MDVKEISKELANKYRCEACECFSCSCIRKATDEMAERVIEKAIQWFYENLTEREVTWGNGTDDIVQAEFCTVEECIEDFKKFINK